MKRIFLLGLLAALAATPACAAHDAPDVQAENRAQGERTWKRAHAGYGFDQLQAGRLSCQGEPAENGGTEALKWLERASRSSDPQTRVMARHELGFFHLALFEDPYTFDPVKDKPKPYCTGVVRSRENTAKGVKYLKACADDKTGLSAGDCEFGLAHNYLYEKQYAPAYFWYATVIAQAGLIPSARKPGEEVKMNKDGTPPRESYTNGYTGPLLSIPREHLTNGGPVDINRLLKNAKHAASKLTKEEVAALDKQAYARYNKIADLIWQDWTRRSARFKLNE